MSASNDICRRLTGAMRLFDAREKRTALARFVAMMKNNGLTFADLKLRPASAGDSDDDTDGNDNNDSYLLQHMQAKIDAAEAKAAQYKKQWDATTQQLTSVTKQLGDAKHQIASMTTQLEAANARIALLVSRVPVPRITHGRWNCLNDLDTGSDCTDKRALKDCLKAGWITEDQQLTPEGEALLRGTPEPAAPAPRVSVKKLKTRLEAVEHERDEAYDRIDEIRTVLQRSEDYSDACLVALAVAKRATERHAGH